MYSVCVTNWGMNTRLIHHINGKTVLVRFLSIEQELKGSILICKTFAPEILYWVFGTKAMTFNMLYPLSQKGEMLRKLSVQ